MNGHIDLHLHSNMSDGVLSPEKLVATAAKAGLKTIALCDHDTVAGVSSAQSAGLQHGLEVISGVELSVAFKGHKDVHLLGYFIDITAPELLQNLQKFSDHRSNRTTEIIEAINLMLFKKGAPPINQQEVEQLASGVIGRPHIARILISKGHARNMEDAFQRFLIPCNVPKLYWDLEEAVKTIHYTGGIAVLAHPTTISRDRKKLTDLITELGQIGLDGLEVYNALASESEMIFLQGLARKLNLLMTAGSDFHGIEGVDQLGKGRGGIRFSECLLPPIRQRVAIRATTTTST